MPFSFTAIIWFVVASGILAGGYFLVDAIGDRREAKVWAKINAAIEKTNVDVSKHNELDDKIAAIAEDARQKAVTFARQVAATCPATPEQAIALSRIR